MLRIPPVTLLLEMRTLSCSNGTGSLVPRCAPTFFALHIALKTTQWRPGMLQHVNVVWWWYWGGRGVKIWFSRS